MPSRRPRYLITTADEQTWKIDQPVLFLGEWCKVYSRMHAWQELDSETVAYHWKDRNRLYRDYSYLVELYERVLPKLANYLNNKQMESFRLTQALMESNERLQEKTLSLSKKVDSQNQEIGQLKRDLDIKKHRLRAFQIATAVTSTIILVKVFLM